MIIGVLQSETVMVAASAETARLQATLASQYSTLAVAVARLQYALARLVPPVDDTRWQGPARFAYEGVLDRLRGSLAAATAELCAARDGTAAALRVIDNRG